MSLCHRPIDSGLSFPAGSGGSGTVTSVAMSVPTFLSVSGSPITTSGTFAVTLATQTANKVFVGPVSGSPANPTFRQLVAEDLNPTYTNGKVLQTDGSGVLSWVTAGGTGTVTSVAMSVPTFLSVTGTPITTSGTFAVTLATQTKNLVFIGPATGAAATPTFRQLQAEDLNTTYSVGQVLKTDGSGVLSWVTDGGGTVTSVAMSVPTFLSVTGTPITTSGTFAVTLATQTANLVFASPASGGAAAPTFRALKGADFGTVTNNYYLKTDGSGNLSWAAVTASPAGSNTQVQYNNSGAFGASANFTFDGVGVTYTNGSAVASNQGFLITNNSSASSSQGFVVIQGVDNTSGNTALIFASGKTVDVLFSSELNNSGTSTKVGASGRFCRTKSDTTNVNQSCLLVNDFTSNSSNPTRAFAINSTSSLNYVESGIAAFEAWTNDRIGLRSGAMPTTAMFQVNWRTGDTLPTMFVGDAASNMTAIWGQSGTIAVLGAGTTNGVKGTTTTGSGVYGTGTSSASIGGEFVAGNTAALGLQVSSTAGARSTDLIRVLAAANDTSLSLNVYDGTVSFFTVNQQGLAKVRVGKQTANNLASIGGTIYVSTTEVTNASSTETDLATYTLKANSLGITGNWIRMTGEFEQTASATSQSVRAYIGTTLLYDSGSITIATATTLIVTVYIVRASSGSQKCIAFIQSNNTTQKKTQYVAAFEDETTDLVLKFTGQGTASDQIAQEIMLIEFGNK